MTPSISVCILNYNYGRYLGQAIDSALRQAPGEYRLVEILVLDDGSTDNSRDVCATYGDQIRLVSLPHRGFGATLTAAVEHARGEWIALLDADDWFVSSKLATAAKAITETSLLVQHWEHVVDAVGQPLLDHSHPGGNTSTLVVRRSAALDLLPVTNEAFFHVLEQVGRGVKLTDPLINYRVHDSNMTDRVTPGAFQDYLRDVHTAIAERLRVLATKPPSWAGDRTLRRLANRHMATAHGHAREAAVQRGCKRAALSGAAAESFWAIRARHGLTQALIGIVSAVTMRPTITQASRRRINRPDSR